MDFEDPDTNPSRVGAFSKCSRCSAGVEASHTQVRQNNPEHVLMLRQSTRFEIEDPEVIDRTTSVAN